MGGKCKLYSGPIPNGFRLVPGTTTYYINESAELYSIYRGSWKQMKVFLSTEGYHHLKIWVDGVMKDAQIHRMVAETFLGLSPGMVVNHLDHNKTNNHVSNLEWTTLKGNSQHAVKQGRYRDTRGTLHGMSKLSFENTEEIRELLRLKTNQRLIAEKFGVSTGTIETIKAGNHWSSDGKKVELTSAS